MDYTREKIKPLLKYNKPFLVSGIYMPPIKYGDTYRCYFEKIVPLVYGASAKLLCEHAQISRELCEHYYYKKLDNDYRGKHFVLCVHARLYTDWHEVERGGLELEDSLADYFPPIAMVAHSHANNQDAIAADYKKVPYGKLLDIRGLPYEEQKLDVSRIWNIKKIGLTENLMREKAARDTQSSSYYSWLADKMLLWRKCRNNKQDCQQMLVKHNLVAWNDAETRADWIMQAIERHPEWTVGQAKKLVSLARIAGVMKNNGINADKWCVKHGAHGNGKN